MSTQLLPSLGTIGKHQSLGGGSQKIQDSSGRWNRSSDAGRRIFKRHETYEIRTIKNGI
jgi:hypothetical protein